MYIHHITLDTGHVRRSARDEVGDEIIAAAQGLIALALRGEHVPIPGRPGWTCTATARGAALLVTVCRSVSGETAPVVTFGVARQSRAGAGLWRSLHRQRGGLPAGAGYATAPDEVPPEPWVAARMEIGATLVAPDEMPWIADFERVVGWAWVERARK